MKTLKLSLAGCLIAVTALVAVNAAEAVLSPRAAANAPRVAASASNTTAAVPPHARGCARSHSTLPDTAAPAASNEAGAHCKTTKKDQGHLPCCS